MPNGKICIECYCIINNASHQCYNCGALQLTFYNKKEKEKEKCVKKSNALTGH